LCTAAGPTQLIAIRLYRVSAYPGRYEAVQHSKSVSIKGLYVGHIRIMYN